MIKLLEKQWVRYILVLIAGIAIGAIFYPTKHIEEELFQKFEQEQSSLKEQN